MSYRLRPCPHLCIPVLWVLTASLAGAATEATAVVRSKYGEIAFRFFPEAAPEHVGYVKELIRRGFYDGTTFHRVIPHFVIQGGDPNSKDDDRSNDGEGEGDRRVKAEFSQTMHYRPGTVGMARDADPDSGSCQFFIALESIPRLDGRYTIFGEVISGLEVARHIANRPRDLLDNPLGRIEMKVSLEEREVPDVIHSARPGGSGEVVTGPGKPKPWDPGNVRWSAPGLTPAAKEPKRAKRWPEAALEVSIDEEGKILDIRFARIDTTGAEEILEAVRRWRFTPARYEGEPAKARFAISSHGGAVKPSRAPGTPIELEAGIIPPGPAVAVHLKNGGPRPARVPVLRLTVDERGQVIEVSLQSSCGDERLDGQAMAAARRMVFSPATREGEPVRVYLNVTARLVEPNGR